MFRSTVSTKYSHRLSSLGLTAISLFIASTHIAQGALTTAVASCSAADSSYATVNQSTFTAGQLMTANMTTPSVCEATSFADFGVLKIKTTTNDSNYQNLPLSGTSASAYANFSSDFYLTDPNLPLNSIISLFVPIEYQLTAVANPASGAPNLASSAVFVLSYDGVNPIVKFKTTSDNNGGDSCPAPLPSPNHPACNGTYQGATGQNWNFTVNSTGGPNVFTLWVQGNASNGLMDSSNTTTVGSIILPSTMSFSYANGSAGASGNGMNFAYEATGIPEPSTFALSGSIGALLLLAARRSKRNFNRPA